MKKTEQDQLVSIVQDVRPLDQQDEEYQQDQQDPTR